MLENKTDEQTDNASSNDNNIKKVSKNEIAYEKSKQELLDYLNTLKKDTYFLNLCKKYIEKKEKNK